MRAFLLVPVLVGVLLSAGCVADHAVPQPSPSPEAPVTSGILYEQVRDPSTCTGMDFSPLRGTLGDLSEADDKVEGAGLACVRRNKIDYRLGIVQVYVITFEGFSDAMESDSQAPARNTGREPTNVPGLQGKVDQAQYLGNDWIFIVDGNIRVTINVMAPVDVKAAMPPVLEAFANSAITGLRKSLHAR